MNVHEIETVEVARNCWTCENLTFKGKDMSDTELEGDVGIIVACAKKDNIKSSGCDDYKLRRSMNPSNPDMPFLFVVELEAGEEE